MESDEYLYELEQERSQQPDRRSWFVIGLLAAFLIACCCVLGLVISYFMFFAGNGSGEIVSEDLAPVAVEQVQNINWQWNELVEAEPASQSTVPNAQNHVLVLRSDGQFSFRADCNVGSGAYTVDGSTLTLQLGPVTATECGPASLSDQFMGLLSSVTSFGLDGDRLRLVLQEEVGSMIFTNGGSAQPASSGPPAGLSPTPQPAPPTPTMGVMPLPIPVFPPEAGAGEPVVFDGSQSQPGSSPIASYDWEFGDGTSAAGATVTHPYAAPGEYAVTLAVTGQDGLSSSATGRIGVREAVPTETAPLPSPGAPGTGLLGPTWQWTELIREGEPSAIPDPVNYTLKFGDDRTLVIVADCTSGGGTYQEDGNRLLFDVSGVSQVDCGPDSLSSQYLALLATVSEYELDEGSLLFYLEGDADRMVFAP
jgi:heat shock protein HslJ